MNCFKNLSVIVLSLFMISGCIKQNIDGEYMFKYIEYGETDNRYTTDCSNEEELPLKIKTVCSMKNMRMIIKDNSYVFYMREDYPEPGYYKLVGDKMYLSVSEDGEYKYTGWFHYRDGKIYYGINETYVVLDN